MIIEPENTAEIQDGRFTKGQSGNPNGRPKGAFNNTTKVAMALLDSEAEAITRKTIELAMSGDMQAIKLILERTIPVRKERLVSVDLPEINSNADIAKANKLVLAAVSSGELTISKGQNLMMFLANIKNAIKYNAIDKVFGSFW